MKAFAAVVFIFICLSIWTPKETLAMDLTKFQWQNRLLFLFAEDDNDPLFKNLQSQIMAQKAEVDDRDLIVFEMLAIGPNRMNNTPLDREATDSIRNQFAIPSNTFSLILVGKDGGIKFKRSDSVDLREIFELIDSMPMRKNEMQRNKK